MQAICTLELSLLTSSVVNFLTALVVRLLFPLPSLSLVVLFSPLVPCRRLCGDGRSALLLHVTADVLLRLPTTATSKGLQFS